MKRMVPSLLFSCHFYLEWDKKERNQQNGYQAYEHSQRQKRRYDSNQNDAQLQAYRLHGHNVQNRKKSMLTVYPSVCCLNKIIKICYGTNNHIHISQLYYQKINGR
jgi:hypothetical protein